MKKIFSAIILICCSNSAVAAYTCNGLINTINQPYDGSVSVVSQALFGDLTPRNVCNLNSNWKSVSIETCKGWLSKLLSHQAQSKPITFQYNDSRTSCSEQPEYDAAENPWSMW